MPFGEREPEVKGVASAVLVCECGARNPVSTFVGDPPKPGSYFVNCRCHACGAEMGAEMKIGPIATIKGSGD